MNTTITSGQAEWLYKILREKGITPDRFQSLQETGFLTDLCDASADFGDRNAYRAALKLPPLKRFLGAATEFRYPAISSPAVPTVFYQTRKGLWVSEEFARRILPMTKKLPALPERAGQYRPLVASANDAEIMGESSLGHVWEASEFCARLTDKLQRQWGNTVSGDLLSNGHANIAHVTGISGEVFTVYVNWNAGYGAWNVYARRLNDGRWLDGSRVFPCN